MRVSVDSTSDWEVVEGEISSEAGEGGRGQGGERASDGARVAGGGGPAGGQRAQRLPRRGRGATTGKSISERGASPLPRVGKAPGRPAAHHGGRPAETRARRKQRARASFFWLERKVGRMNAAKFFGTHFTSVHSFISRRRPCPPCANRVIYWVILIATYKARRDPVAASVTDPLFHLLPEVSRGRAAVRVSLYRGPSPAGVSRSPSQASPSRVLAPRRSHRLSPLPPRARAAAMALGRLLSFVMGAGAGLAAARWRRPRAGLRRPRVVLFGDSITQRAGSPAGGWGARFSDEYQRKVRRESAPGWFPHGSRAF